MCFCTTRNETTDHGDGAGRGDSTLSVLCVHFSWEENEKIKKYNNNTMAYYDRYDVAYNKNHNIFSPKKKIL